MKIQTEDKNQCFFFIKEYVDMIIT